METRILIATLIFGATISIAPVLFADRHQPPDGANAAPPVEAAKSGPSEYDVPISVSRPYSILGTGPVTGWDTFSRATLDGAQSPSAWDTMLARVSLGGGLWTGFALDLELSPRPQV